MNSCIENNSTQRKCTKCKTVKPLNIEYFNRDKNRVFGFMYKCKQCEKLRKDLRKDRWSKKTDEQRGRQILYQSQPEKRAALRLHCYKIKDAQNGRLTDVDYPFILHSLSKPCEYCGHESSGLDRVDNSLGHLKYNCVPCCHECNTTKNNHFSFNEMKIIGEAIRLVKDKRLNI